MLEGTAPRTAVRELALPELTLASLRQLTLPLLAAALAETLLLRLITRVGVHLPKSGTVSDAFAAASFLGSLAFNFASLLAIVLAVVVLGSAVRHAPNVPARLALAGLSAALLAGLALTLLTGAAAADALFGLAAALLVGLLGLRFALGRDATPAARLALVLIVAAYFCYQYYVLGNVFYRLLDYAAVPPLSVAALRLGEALTVGAAIAVFWAWGLPRWRRAGTAGLAGVGAVLLILAFAGLSPVSTISILALWTTGLSFVLPSPVYLVALALYLLTLVACWRSGDAFWTAAGLLLVLLAGYMPEATYQHLLLLLGVGFLSGVARWAVPEGSRPE